MRIKTTVGQVSKYDLKHTIKASNRRVGGLVDSCVGGLVWDGQKELVLGTYGFFFHQNKWLFFEMEWKRVTWTISTTNVQYSI
jgi:hypothetical protein